MAYNRRTVNFFQSKWVKIGVIMVKSHWKCVFSVWKKHFQRDFQCHNFIVLILTKSPGSLFNSTAIWSTKLRESKRILINILSYKLLWWCIRDLAHFDSHIVFIKVCYTPHKTDCRRKKPSKFVPLKLEICLNYAFSLDLCWNIVWTLSCFNGVCMYG